MDEQRPDQDADCRARLCLEEVLPLLDLPAVHQELPGAPRFVVLAGGGIGRDVHVEEPHLAVADPRVGLGDRAGAFAERLDLRAGEDEASLDLISVPVRMRPASTDSMIS